MKRIVWIAVAVLCVVIVVVAGYYYLSSPSPVSSEKFKVAVTLFGAA
jgi:Ni,Fe-hydrogenase I cytochrome b subunit